MSTDADHQSQTAEFIRDNIVKIVDKNAEFYGSGFFIDVNRQRYCVTCHHCICTLDKIFVERFGHIYPTKWIEEYSEMRQDLAVLKVKTSPLKPLIYAKEAMGDFAVTIRGFSGENIKSLPEGTSGRDSSLSDTDTPFVVEEDDHKGNNKWNKKPPVYVNVYECKGKFDLGFSGSPVCYKGPNKVVGVFTAKDDDYGYVIPIQTLLDKFNKNEGITLPTTDRKVSELIEKGNALFGSGKYEDAINLYDVVLFDPNYVTALNNKGWALSRMGRHEEALRWITHALEIDSNHARALNIKGYSLIRLGKFEESIKYLDDAIAIDPNYFSALNNKGAALADLGKHKEAIKWYDKALAIDPNNVTTLDNKRLTQEKIKKKRVHG